MKKIVFILALAAGMVAVSAQRTTRTGLHAAPDAETVSVPSDTIVAPGLELVEVKGYDKPLRSRRETFFVSNPGDKAIQRVALTISYFDTSNNLLHRASHNVAVDVPAGETRMAGVRSWDVQNGFYYLNSTVSHKSTTARPYTVTINVDTLFTAP